MTRETKAGIVVSGSFLCLVGVVVVAKLKEKEAGTLAIAPAEASSTSSAVSTAPASAKTPANQPRPLSATEKLALATPPGEGPIRQTGMLGGDTPLSSAQPGSSGAAPTAPGFPPAATNPSMPATGLAMANARDKTPETGRDKSAPSLDSKSSEGLGLPPLGAEERRAPSVPSEDKPKPPSEQRPVVTDPPPSSGSAEPKAPPSLTGPSSPSAAGLPGLTDSQPSDGKKPGTPPAKQPTTPPAQPVPSADGLASSPKGEPSRSPAPGASKSTRPPADELTPPSTPRPADDLTPPRSPLGDNLAGPPGKKPQDSATTKPLDPPSPSGAFGSAPTVSGPPAREPEPAPKPTNPSAIAGPMGGPPPSAGLASPPASTPASPLPSPPASPLSGNTDRPRQPESAGLDQPGIRLGSVAASPPSMDRPPQPPSAPRDEPRRDVPPLGAPALGTSAPLRVPTPPGSPQVESYDEETYRWQPGDTFARVSELYYRSDRYARALVLFNREHPRGVDGVRQEPPALGPGQALYVPPVRVLEKNYPQVIGSASMDPPPSSSSAATPPVGLAPPIGQSARALATATPTVPPTPASSDRLYRVRRGGEWFYEIARHTLGSGDRWWDIARLNQRYSAQDRVPEGTLLHMPPDARIESQDAP